MALAPKLYPAGLADRNSNSAYEKLKFIEEHYEELMQAYQVIMEHLKIVNESNQVELPDDLVTYDSDNNVLKSGENTIQISADVPENIVTYDPDDNVLKTGNYIIKATNNLPPDPWNYDGLFHGNNVIKIRSTIPENIVTSDGILHYTGDHDGVISTWTTASSETYGDFKWWGLRTPLNEDGARVRITLPVNQLTVVHPHGGGGDAYLTELREGAPNVLINLNDIVTTDNISQHTTNFLTSSDLPDLSGYVETSDVANEAGKIPRYNSQGHLVLPDGTEIWCEDNE